MDIFRSKNRVVITCSNRLSPFLHQELSRLGDQADRVFKTGVELRGDLMDCMRWNIRLRSASQVLYELKQFTIHHPDELYRIIRELPWEKIIKPDGYFSVTSNVSHPTVNNPLFVNVKIKDAIADRFREKLGIRPNSGPSLDQAVIHLYWKDEFATLFLDTSGETLSKHGYRKIPGKAPMLESLAASTILASRWNNQTHFINPMCGSGTLAIEAAMLATGRVPGLYRDNYAFMHYMGYEETMYRRLLQQAESEVHPIASGQTIVASDISADAVNISRINAGIAGVEDCIQFEQGDFSQTKIPEGDGAVFFNPEYGDRLGDIIELEDTYAAMGDFLKKQCKGYWGYIFTGNLDLAKKIGLKPNRRIEFFNGKIDCRLLEYELYAGSRERV
jgi:23S rRNA G2445 N2-methylase RlmL